MHGSIFYVIEQTSLRCRFVFASYSKFKKFEKSVLYPGRWYLKGYILQQSLSDVGKVGTRFE
jgi:hypothetical protein